MTQMQYLQFFADKEVLLEPFDDAERGRLLTAMLSYALHCEEITLSGNERFVWPVFKQMIDQSRTSLDNKKKAGSKNGQNQERSDANNEEQRRTEPNRHEQAKTEDYINKNHDSGNKNHESDIDNAGGNTARAARFTPPTVNDVRAYAKSEGLQIDAQQFVDFYISKGWKVGTTPMKDWRATVRNWVRREQASEKPPPVRRVTAQQYTQRNYSEDELSNDLTNELLQEAKKEAPHVSI